MRTVSEKKTLIRAVVFDYGNVLSFHHLPSDVEAMAQVCGITVERFTPPYWELRMAYDRADLDRTSYWTGVAGSDGRVLSSQQIDELVAIDSQGWSRINPAAMQWVERIRRAGFRLALLSNMPAEISRYLAANCEWPALFDHLIFSCDVHSAKPEPAIYRTCLEQLQTPPQEVLFFDDRQENVEGAAALGIHGVLFDTLERTVGRVAGQFEIPLPVGVEATGRILSEPLLGES